MKKIIFKSLVLVVALMQLGCSKKTISVDTDKENLPTQNCPKEGSCNIKYIRNTSLEIRKDEIGKIFYDLKNNPEKSVVIIEYFERSELGLQDGNYREEIMFHINNNQAELQLSDEFLVRTNLVFGKYCYCKGEAGLRRVEEGLIKLKQNEKEIDFILTFKTTVSHKLSSTQKHILKI